MGKPDPSAGQMKGLELMEHPEEDFLPARCSVLGCQGWEGLRAWGAGWTRSSFRARVSEDQWVWLWQSKNLPPPLVGGTSNVPSAGSLSWGWHWHWGLAAGGAWECSMSPRLWKRHPGFHHHPKRHVFLSSWARLGRFLLSLFVFFFQELWRTMPGCRAGWRFLADPPGFSPGYLRIHLCFPPPLPIAPMKTRDGTGDTELCQLLLLTRDRAKNQH